MQKTERIIKSIYFESTDCIARVPEDIRARLP